MALRHLVKGMAMRVSILTVSCYALALAGLVVAMTLQAAPNPGDTDLIRDRQDRLLEEQRRRLDGLKDMPGSATPATAPNAAADNRCFPIKTVQRTGADALGANERTQILAPYTGQCLGVAQLNALLKTITERYIDKGLVTSRAYLPQQDLSSGNLNVQVVEGRL